MLLVLIVAGTHSNAVFSENDGSGCGTMQTLWTVVSNPQLFSTIKLIWYVPGFVNLTSIICEPHWEGIKPLIFPNDPFWTIHPLFGLICHSLLFV